MKISLYSNSVRNRIICEGKVTQFTQFLFPSPSFMCC